MGDINELVAGMMIHYECGDRDGGARNADAKRDREGRDGRKGRGGRDGGMAQEYWNKYARMSYK
jgi:hypothetical protein